MGKAIVCGEFYDSEFPSEANLCKRYGVSRSAVREAVKMLSAKGLVVSVQRVGVNIRPSEDWNIFDPDILNWMLNAECSTEFLKEFLQLRISVEPQAAFLAATNGSKAQLNAMAEALDKMKAADKIQLTTCMH